MIEAASCGPHRLSTAKGSGSRLDANEWNSALPAAMLSLQRAGGHWSGSIMPGRDRPRHRAVMTQWTCRSAVQEPGPDEWARQLNSGTRRDGLLRSVHNANAASRSHVQVVFEIDGARRKETEYRRKRIAHLGKYQITTIGNQGRWILVIRADGTVTEDPCTRAVPP